MNNLNFFSEQIFIEALKTFFIELKVPIDYISNDPVAAEDIFSERYNEGNEAHQLIKDIYPFGMVNDAIFGGEDTFDKLEQIKVINTDYDGLLIFGVTLNQRRGGLLPTRSQLAEIARALNREFYYTPVVVIFKYDNYIAFANTERTAYKQEWREGEKAGKVTMLKDIDVTNTHAAHLKILNGLTIDREKICTFVLLYRFWQKTFSLQALNDQFYSDLQEWFYYATKNITLPFKPAYIEEKENIKNFLIRLLSRTLFCWFIKEKGLIRSELLELTDWKGNRFHLTKDIEDENFLQSNSYYRGILQNVFFYSLNQKDKKTIKDFKWTHYWHKDFNIDWLLEMPFLNGGIFDKLDEDNAKESIEDSVIKIPNYLFYGIEENVEIKRGRGKNARTVVETVERKGLNNILMYYKFTLDENTPFEEDIALDPEMLGMVFENLLAELDPNLDDSTKKSIKNLTGSYYTPRKIIIEMVNDSLNLYLNKYIKEKYPELENIDSKVEDLTYRTLLREEEPQFEEAVVEALDKYKVLDPACGSGAFPMGMLHRIVEVLKVVDMDNKRWLALKLKNVEQPQRAEFKKLLTSHMDDYSRKLGIIRDNIYGIDIQPMAVQITKLRFFISLLIDQKTDKGIAPMPNIETKIICANSLKSLETDMFSDAAIEKLIDARARYYQPDMSSDDRELIVDEIVDVLDEVFPSFASQITGKNISGQNKELLRHWFTHGSIASPFFNMDFFYPELKESDGFDCVIGNPPYGGTRISDDVRNALNIESKDPYGAFVARFMQRNTDTKTPLKHGGVLSFIVSDTFMTIKSHFELRQHLMKNYVHKMIRVHPDTFKATVNTVIILVERNKEVTVNENHICLMADLTNISIHDNYERFTEVLEQTKGVDFKNEDSVTSISNEEYALYYYSQSLIKTNSHLPFFVASPKLFALMNDSGNDLEMEIKEIGNKRASIRKIHINSTKLDVVKLGDVEKIAKGMDSDIDFVYRANESIPIIRTHYRIVPSEKIRKDSEVKQLTESEKLNGVRNAESFLIPFNKGGSSNSSDGWLPNYYVPIEYYIDWTVEAVNNHYHRNRILYFEEGLTYSFRGEYSPTFRLKNIGPFDANSSFIGSENIEKTYLITILSSKFMRFCFKGYIQHTIASDIDKIKEIPIIVSEVKNIEKYTNLIIENQKTNPRYDYASHEQIEIDKLVYEAYGLNAEDIQEVENWYARRYPRLSAAQKANLRALGKSDDYLELYGLK